MELVPAVTSLHLVSAIEIVAIALRENAQLPA